MAVDIVDIASKAFFGLHYDDELGRLLSKCEIVVESAVSGYVDPGEKDELVRDAVRQLVLDFVENWGKL